MECSNGGRNEVPLEQKEGGPKWIVKVCEHIGPDNCLHSLKIFAWIIWCHACPISVLLVLNNDHQIAQTTFCCCALFFFAISWQNPNPLSGKGAKGDKKPPPRVWREVTLWRQRPSI